MRKIICTIMFIVLFVVIGINICHNNSEVQAEDSLYLKLNDKCDNLSENFKSNQREANVIMDRFFKSLVSKNGFSCDDNVYTVNGMYAEDYPLFFAGAYINVDGNLVLQVTEDYYSQGYKDSDWYSEFVEVAGSENFYCHPVKHSYSELINAISDIFMGNKHKELVEAGIKITGAGINDYKNLIDVYVKTQADYENIIGKINSELYSITVLDCTIKDCVGLYPGGGATRYSTGNCYFSVACRVRKNLPYGGHTDGFLTCAHVFSGTSDVYITTGSPNNTLIGTSYSSWQKYTSTADVAFIETNDNTTLYNTVFMNTTILNPSYSTTMGSVVYKRGDASGTTQGTVIDSSYGYTDSSGFNYSDLVWAQAGTIGGDSGGIVYSEPDATGYADCLGIVKGSIVGSLLFTKMYNDLGALQSGPIYFSLY